MAVIFQTNWGAFPDGTVTEAQLEQNQWWSVTDGVNNPQQVSVGTVPGMASKGAIMYFPAHSGNSGDPHTWQNKIRMRADPFAQGLETMRVTQSLYFYPSWISGKGGKISFTSGTDSTPPVNSNPTTNGTFDYVTHWYSVDNTKVDPRGTVHKVAPNNDDYFELVASIYSAHTPNGGTGYGAHYFLVDPASPTERYLFTKGVTYDFEFEFVLNTPGLADGILRINVQEDGGGFQTMLEYTDFNWRGNFTSTFDRIDYVPFPGGNDASWEVQQVREWGTSDIIAYDTLDAGQVEAYTSFFTNCTGGTAPDQNQIILGWTHPDLANTQTLVQYSTDNSTWITDTTTVAGASTHTVTGLSAGTLYYFRIQGQDNGGINLNSNFESSINCTTAPAVASTVTLEISTDGGTVFQPVATGANLVVTVPDTTTDIIGRYVDTATGCEGPNFTMSINAPVTPPTAGASYALVSEDVTLSASSHNGTYNAVLTIQDAGLTDVLGSPIAYTDANIPATLDVSSLTAGTYTATLVVTDDQTTTATNSTTWTVTAPTSTLVHDLANTELDMTAGSYTGNYTAVLTIQDSGLTDVLGSPISYTQATLPASLDVSALGNETYTATLVITDGAGQTSTSTDTWTVGATGASITNVFTNTTPFINTLVTSGDVAAATAISAADSIRYTFDYVTDGVGATSTVLTGVFGTAISGGDIATVLANTGIVLTGNYGNIAYEHPQTPNWKTSNAGSLPLSAGVTQDEGQVRKVDIQVETLEGGANLVDTWTDFSTYLQITYDNGTRDINNDTVTLHGSNITSAGTVSAWTDFEDNGGTEQVHSYKFTAQQPDVVGGTQLDDAGLGTGTATDYGNWAIANLGSITTRRGEFSYTALGWSNDGAGGFIYYYLNGVRTQYPDPYSNTPGNADNEWKNFLEWALVTVDPTLAIGGSIIQNVQDVEVRSHQGTTNFEDRLGNNGEEHYIFRQHRMYDPTVPETDNGWGGHIASCWIPAKAFVNATGTALPATPVIGDMWHEHESGDYIQFVPRRYFR